jgi:hypothetical protein
MRNKTLIKLLFLYSNNYQIMKKLLLIFSFALLKVGTSIAQNDTLFYDGFQTLSVDDIGVYPFGDDTTWVSFDADGLPPSGGDPTESSWYLDYAFRNAIDPITGDTNIIMNSLSWLEGSVPGNRNWLITPPIHVPDASAVLHWQSATFQLPRYMDGYSVIVSPSGSNDAVTTGVFTDTIFKAASMDEILVGDGDTINPSYFSYTPGYIHGDYLNTWADTSLWEYYIANDATLNFGLLEPHSVSLAAYAGKTIYIAFLHDSDDDFYLGLDDVLVRGNTVTTKEPTHVASNIQTYPNPVSQILNLNYTISATVSEVTVSVHQTDGKEIVQRNFGRRQAGQYFEQFHVGMLADGAYQLVLKLDGETVIKPFIKR